MTEPTETVDDVLAEIRAFPEAAGIRALQVWADRIERAMAASAEPVAWSCTEFIEDANGLAIGIDEPRVVWDSGRPQGDEDWAPLYGGPAHAPTAPSAINSRLYHAVNLMMAVVCSEGEIHNRTKETEEVMAALAEIDGGTYAPAVPVESPPASDYPECSGDPASCPENEGYGCCKPNQPPASVPDGLVAAARRLAFAARTSGGTAGHDSELCAALDAIESILATNQEGAAP